MTDKNTLAQRLKYRMDLLNYSPHKLAKESEVSAATIYRILTGDVHQLRTDSLLKLATTLHTSIDYLTGRTQEQTVGDTVRTDKNAQYIFGLYGEMNASQMQQLVQFAEFVRYRAFSVKDLLKGYSDLYQFCLDSMAANAWNKNDARFQKAIEQMAAAAIALVPEEKNENEPSKNA